MCRYHGKLHVRLHSFHLMITYLNMTIILTYWLLCELFWAYFCCDLKLVALNWPSSWFLALMWTYLKIELIVVKLILLMIRKEHVLSILLFTTHAVQKWKYDITSQRKQRELLKCCFIINSSHNLFCLYHVNTYCIVYTVGCNFFAEIIFKCLEIKVRESEKPCIFSSLIIEV